MFPRQSFNHSPETTTAIVEKLKQAVPEPNETCFVAVCGPENAGKRTFIKLLELVAGRHRTNESRQHFDRVVQRLVIENMRIVVQTYSETSLTQYDMYARSWERDCHQRHDLFEFAKQIYRDLRTEHVTFNHKLRESNVVGECAADLLKEHEQILDEKYCPSADDILRLITLQGYCDLSDITWNGTKYKFFDYNNYCEKSPYKEYKEGPHRIVYIMDFGVPVAELQEQIQGLMPIVKNHTCPVDIFFNKAQLLDARDRQEVYAAFNLDAETRADQNLSSLVTPFFLDEARSGNCVVRCSATNWINHLEDYLIRNMFDLWSNPGGAHKYYMNPKNV